VDPVAAAYAFLSLNALLAAGTGASGTVLMREAA
jgi:hypothetical protein